MQNGEDEEEGRGGGRDGRRGGEEGGRVEGGRGGGREGMAMSSYMPSVHLLSCRGSHTTPTYIVTAPKYK